MNPYFARLHAFWAGRTSRERTFLAAGATVLLLGLGYGLVVEPLVKANHKLAASLPKQRAELRLMRAQVDEIERLRAGSRSAGKTGSALVHAIESAAAAHGVREAVTGLAPLAADRVRVTTGPMPASAWLAWFSDLERQGISVVSWRLTGEDKAGRFAVEALLAGGGR
jgi:type II secretory pathway component PulM